MALKKDQPVYAEMRAHAPSFLVICGVYLALTVVLFFALGHDTALILGALYGIALCVLNFLLLGKTAQKAVRMDEKSARNYMNTMYCVRYLGLFAALTAAALIPFISLITAAVPLFFPKAAITARAFIHRNKEE